MPALSGWLKARWAAPAHIVAGTTTRHALGNEGASHAAALASYNLGLKVGDDAAAVAENRASLQAFLQQQLVVEASESFNATAQEPHMQWLDQVHGNACIHIDRHQIEKFEHPPQADSMWSDLPGVALAIQSADCVPVVLTDTHGELIGAAHGGWRGLTNDVLAVLIESMPVSPDKLCAWIGPCIGPGHFEVGEDVWGLLMDEYASFVLEHSGDSSKRFVDLPHLAEHQLGVSGVTEVALSGVCTYASADMYSHRQATQQNGQGAQTGRMATVICRGQ
jgi:YfiH family protein